MQVGTFQNPFMQSPPKAVRALLIANVSVFLVQWLVDSMAGSIFSITFALNMSSLMNFHVWQLFTYMFLHGGVMHLLMNMLMLYFFGCEMEHVLGTRRFLMLYFVSGVLGGLGWLLIDGLMGRAGLCLGASGAALGVIGAFGAMFPDRVITLLLFFVLPVTMTARTMAIGLGAISLGFMVFSDGNIAHSAHLAGGIAGYVYGLRMASRRIFLGMESAGGGSTRFGSWLSNLRAGFRRRGMRVHTSESSGRQDAPTREEVDRLLEKISAKGIESLTREERRRLEQASVNLSGKRRAGRGERPE